MNELKEMKDAKFALECNLQEHKEQIASLDRQVSFIIIFKLFIRLLFTKVTT